MGIAIVLMYEVVTFLIYRLCLVSHNGNSNSNSNSPRFNNNNNNNNNNRSLLPLLLQHQQQQQQQGVDVSLAPVWLVLLWAISTTYGVFYSFEVVFLYVNDGWYQLLGLQLFMTLSDAVTWIHFLAVAKYRLFSKQQQQQQQHSVWSSSWSCSQWMSLVSCSIKLLHLVFNVTMEADVWILRHWVFLLEDSTYLALAPVCLGCGWYQPLIRNPRTVVLQLLVGVSILMVIRFGLPTQMSRLT